VSKHTHDCPLCDGTGKVSKRVAESKIDIRDREKWNESMRKINAAARARKKLEKSLAT